MGHDRSGPAQPQHEPEVFEALQRKTLTPAAERALAEAEERRRKAEENEAARANAQETEVGGQEGPDPVRYGDWEKGGICSDF